MDGVVGRSYLDVVISEEMGRPPSTKNIFLTCGPKNPRNAIYTNHSQANRGPGVRTNFPVLFIIRRKKHPFPSLQPTTSIYESRNEKRRKERRPRPIVQYSNRKQQTRTGEGAGSCGIGRMHTGWIVRVRVRGEREKEKRLSRTTFRKVAE